jgi:NAD(P)-dependent dehydrogenase (short-subunit alcohol dehydrogenase family)
MGADDPEGIDDSNLIFPTNEHRTQRLPRTWITGRSRGIGKAVAQALMESGARVCGWIPRGTRGSRSVGSGTHPGSIAIAADLE